MPTIEANARMLGLPPRVALAAQLAVAIPVVIMVWRAFRDGPSARASALLVVGTFLATPHAFNYDMPMTTAAIVWYFEERRASLRLGEAVVLTLALILPFAMWALGDKGPPISWAAFAPLFVMIARARPASSAERAVEPRGEPAPALG
jgi:hypothetical protein